jgi:hypothetical protein
MTAKPLSERMEQQAGACLRDPEGIAPALVQDWATEVRALERGVGLSEPQKDALRQVRDAMKWGSVVPGSEAEALERNLHEALDIVLSGPTLERVEPKESVWIPVSERLPEHDHAVLVWVAAGGKPRAIRAWYIKPFTEEDCGGETDESMLDERNGTYYFKEGWHESSDYDDEHFYAVSGVTHWMPLPTPPRSRTQRTG